MKEVDCLTEIPTTAFQVPFMSLSSLYNHQAIKGCQRESILSRSMYLQIYKGSRRNSKEETCCVEKREISEAGTMKPPRKDPVKRPAPSFG